MKRANEKRELIHALRVPGEARLKLRDGAHGVVRLSAVEIEASGQERVLRIDPEV